MGRSISGEKEQEGDLGSPDETAAGRIQGWADLVFARELSVSGWDGGAEDRRKSLANGWDTRDQPR